MMGRLEGLMVLSLPLILGQELLVSLRSLEFAPVLALKFSECGLARYMIFVIYFCPPDGISRNHCQSLTQPSSGPRRTIGLYD